MFCHNCGTKVERDDLFCPNCGSRLNRPEAQPPQSSQFYPPAAPPAKKTGLIIGLVLGLVLVLGLGAFFAYRFWGSTRPSQSSTAASTTRSLAVESSQPTETTATIKLGLGEAGIVDGLAIIIDDVTLPDQADLLTEPAEGFDYILVWYSLVNRTKKTINTPAAEQFLLVSSKSKQDPPDASALFLEDEDAYLPGQELAAGATSSGWLIYQLPAKSKTITVHYFSDPGKTEPDLAFSFPTSQVNLQPSPTPIETTGSTSLAAFDYTAYLAGQWAAMPDEFGNTHVYAFAEKDSAGIASAYSYYETTLDAWYDDEVWYLDNYDWVQWWTDQDVLVLAHQDTQLRLLITPEADDIVLLTYLDTQDQVTLHKLADQIDLPEYLVGIWLPDAADSEGIQAALTFASDSSFVLTGSKKTRADATVEEWPEEDYWEILGTRDGSWWFDGEEVMIELDEEVHVYTIVIEGPNQCTINYGDSWSRSFSRVSLDY